MQSLPANIYSVDGVREIDRATIMDHGVPGYTLMTRAAEAAVAAAIECFPKALRWQVLSGAGNNGGDGYVVARLAMQQGMVVSVVTLVDPETLNGDAATAYSDFAAEGGIVVPWSQELDTEAELLVDALLGSGLEREVTGEFAAAVAALNEHAAPVLALDIPTGINGDSGAIMGVAVRAAMTVTFVGLKGGLFLGDAPDHCGAVRFAGLDIPESARDDIAALYRRIDDEVLSGALQPRSPAAHKGDFGHVLVIGGGEGMPGAARLAGEAALRAGAGRVSIATHPAHAAGIAATCPELMAFGVASMAELEPLLEKADVIAFGPGLGQSEWARELYAGLAASTAPAVWDADALNLLAEAPSKQPNRVLTPHPGEAARLLGKDTAAIQANRPAALAELAEKFGGIVVLKGAGSLISSMTRVPALCTAGNPGMAAPGMGDVLTGVIAALIAQGLDNETAAAVGVEAHARAGDHAAQAGQRGMIASDLIAELRAVLNP